MRDCSPEFPLNALPNGIKQIVLKLNQCLGFPIDYAATAILLTIATAIGKTRKLKVKTSWYECSSLFVCLVGRPGINKSHPLFWAVKPLYDASETSIRLSKENKNDGFTSESMFSLTAEPIRHGQIVANNITPEALIVLLGQTPRVLVWSDELATFLKNLNKYNSGSDVEMILSIFSGQPIIRNLKTQETEIIRDAFACIAGTTQPDVLKTLFKTDNNNGLRDRFLFVVLEGTTKAKMSDIELPETLIPYYYKLINRILQLELTSEGSSVMIEFENDAREYAYKWFDKNVEQINEAEEDVLASIYAKLDTYFFRFCLIIQVAKWACGDGSIKKVDVDSVRRAERLTEYFRFMNVRAMQLTAKNPVDSLTELQSKIYAALLQILKDQPFQTATAVKVAMANGMSERSIHYFLTNRKLFQKIKNGNYKLVNQKI